MQLTAAINRKLHPSNRLLYGSPTVDPHSAGPQRLANGDYGAAAWNVVVGGGAKVAGLKPVYTFKPSDQPIKLSKQ